MIRRLKQLALVALLPVIFAALSACEDLEVADYNSEFRQVPTIERAPTVEAAPTIAAAPTTTQFEGFEQAPTAEKFEGFETAPTVEQAEGFKQAPTVTQFEGFNDENPCLLFLEQPTPRNAERAAEWAMGQLDGAGGQIDPNDPGQTSAACQAALNK